MMDRKSLSAGLLAAGALWTAGCAVTPFAPIAVPDATSLVWDVAGPEMQGERYKAELEELQKATPEDYTIKPGDVFAIVIDNQLELSRPAVKVMPNGAISVAPIGYVKIAGLTYPEASELLRKKYNEFLRDCSLTLEPVEMQPDTFTISGMVKSPGVYPFVFGSCRLADAVTTAKGFMEASGENGNRYQLADLRNAYIMRKGKILPVDFVKALSKGDSLNNIPIMNGDTIMIPSLENGRVTILGEVGGPACIPYQPDLTVLQAVALAGGLKETNSRDIKVIRGGLNNPAVYNLDIRDLRYGKIMDFPLQPLDIVFVPRDMISEWNVIIKQIVPTIQFLNGLAGPFGSPSTFLYR